MLKIYLWSLPMCWVQTERTSCLKVLNYRCCEGRPQCPKTKSLFPGLCGMIHANIKTITRTECSVNNSLTESKTSLHQQKPRKLKIYFVSVRPNFVEVTWVILLPLRRSHLEFLFTFQSVSLSPPQPLRLGMHLPIQTVLLEGSPRGSGPLLQAVWCWAGADEPQPPPRVRSSSSNTPAGCQAKAVALIKHGASADPAYTRNGRKRLIIWETFGITQQLLTLTNSLLLVLMLAGDGRRA